MRELVNEKVGFQWFTSCQLLFSESIRDTALMSSKIASLPVKWVIYSLWVALMLTYLLGDVLRIYAGDFTAGEMGGKKVTQGMLLGMAILMLIPIVMLFLSLTLTYPLNRWVNIIVAIFLFGFNLIGLPTYPSAYDKRLNISTTK